MPQPFSETPRAGARRSATPTRGATPRLVRTLVTLPGLDPSESAGLRAGGGTRALEADVARTSDQPLAPQAAGGTGTDLNRSDGETVVCSSVKEGDTSPRRAPAQSSSDSVIASVDWHPRSDSRATGRSRQRGSNPRAAHIKPPPTQRCGSPRCPEYVVSEARLARA